MADIEVDNELVALGELVLGNAFYRDYSALVAKYQAAAAGLETDRFDERLSTMSNLYSMADMSGAAVGLLQVEILRGGEKIQCGTMHEALQAKGDEIQLGGRTVFVWKQEIGWYLAESLEVDDRLQEFASFRP